MNEIILFINDHLMLSVAVVAVMVLLTIVELMRKRGSANHLTPVQTTQMINHDNAVIIDTRPNDVYRKGHIIDAQSLTPKDINDNTKKLEKFKSKPVILVCTAGVESQKMAAQLLKRGYNAYSLAGGMRAWINAQMPLVKE